jgi:protein-tyrosine phosphatase
MRHGIQRAVADVWDWLQLRGRMRSGEDSVRHITFVCKGNLCRSPYAEAYARSLGMEAESFGLSTVPGGPADETAMRIASERGLRLYAHRTRVWSSDALRRGSFVVVMEPWHGRRIAEVVSHHDATLNLLGQWCRPRRLSIKDPYGRPDDDFRACFVQIEHAIQRIRETRVAADDAEPGHE